jgi:ribosomal protein S17E
MTLEEIKENYNPKFIELVREIYIKKFSEEFEDNKEKRENIIKKIKEVLNLNF